MKQVGTGQISDEAHSSSMNLGIAILPGRHAGRAFERDVKAVGALAGPDGASLCRRPPCCPTQHVVTGAHPIYFDPAQGEN